MEALDSSQTEVEGKVMPRGQSLLFWEQKKRSRPLLPLLPETKRISSSPLIVVVKASVVFSNSWNMSAEYYISESQTRLLIEKIKNKQTISEIKHFIDTIISDNYIRVDSKNKMFINSAIKQALIEIAAMLQ